MRILYILTILGLEFLDNKTVYGTAYISSGTWATTGTTQWNAGNGWYYMQSTCRMDFPGVVFSYNEGYLFFYMNTVIRNYVDWTYGTVIQTGDQCVLVRAYNTLAGAFNYEHQFQYQPAAVEGLSGSCYIFDSEASATNFAASFNCGITQTSTTSSSTTVLTTTVSSTSSAAPTTSTSTAAPTTTSTSTSVPTTTSTSTAVPTTTSTSTAVPTTTSTSTAAPTTTSTSTAAPTTTVSETTTSTTVPTTTVSPSSTTVSTATVSANVPASAGRLQEAAEMKNLIVTSTPLFVHQTDNVLKCGRLCLRNNSCMSMFMTKSGNNVRCDGHSTIYTNGVPSNETSYYIVI